MKLRFLLVLCLFFALPVLALDKKEESKKKPDQKKKEEPEKKVLPQKISGYAEKGVFKLYKQGTSLGTIQYDLQKTGQYSRTFEIVFSGQKVVRKISITPDKNGYWQSARINANVEVLIKRKGNQAEYTARGKTYSSKLTDGHYLYESFGPVFETLMLRHYDLKKKGIQKFSRFLIPSTTVEMAVEYKGERKRELGKKLWTFQRFDATFVGITLEIWADKDCKIYRMKVPVQYVDYVRNGFEGLMKEEKEDPLLSKSQYDVIKSTVCVPMRDKIHLSTDLYFPKDVKKKVPVILIRTPYKKALSELDARYFARRGYAVAVQDCRGRFDSQGVWEPFVNEEKDGYDAVEWLAAREWSTGKVGMIGGSYVGWTQIWAAVGKPPHLTTIIPQVAPPDPFFNIPYEYGVFFILGSIWWAEILETNATADLSQKSMSKINDRKYEEILKTLPVIDLDKKILGKENTYWRKWIDHNSNDAYWERSNFMDKLEGLDIPVFLLSGWFDGDGIGSKLNYMRLKKSKNKYQKLVLGPWGHTTESSRRHGDQDFGPQAAPDLQKMYLRWFDFWLKGIKNGIDQEPLVQVFVMFANKWLKGNTYPLPETKFTRVYLSSTGGANTSKGDGRLLFTLPQKGKAFDSYEYDPGDPTPWPEYYFKSKEEREAEKKSTQDVEKIGKKVMAFHQKVTDTRKDILVYETEALKDPLAIAGPLSAVLYASSSAKDTDWCVTLMDIDPQGRIFHLARGVLRARYRNSMKKAEFLEKDKVYKFAIDLWQTGILFQKGHKIRVEISSCLFPMYSRNLNTGGHNEKETQYIKASQRIYHSEKYPSHILLPVVEVK